MPLVPGQKLGPYEIVAPLGTGGMGEVYRARDPRLGRDVAIKISRERFSDRFEREARAVAALNHPHVCTLFDVGPDYLVMEYVEGKPLRGPLPVKTALQYGVQTADALHAAHSHGVVHRDLKPANILIAKSGVKLLDFGLARIDARSAASAAGDLTATVAEPLTKENTILGTLQYMAPEQLEGKPADARSDIFAFGLVLYEAISGKPAFTAASQASLIAAILKEEPPALSTLQPLMPAALERVVRKCMAKDPDARWQSAADLCDELRWISEAPAESAAAPTTGRRKMPGWIVAAVALAIGIAGGMFWQSSRAQAPAVWVATRMGGPSTALYPRISPDGQMLAFLTNVDGLTQVAVMKADGSSWTLLSNQKDSGYVADLAWARDGSKIYFSRYFDRPRGVYSVPLLGGEPRLVRENAAGGYPLPDGSLILASPSAQGYFQLQRFWPETGREELLPVFFDATIEYPSAAVFPDGKEIAVFGMCGATREQAGVARLYALDLESKKARPLESAAETWQSVERPVAAMPDGKSILTAVYTENVLEIVKIPRDGSLRRETLFTVPIPGSARLSLSAGADGSAYLDSWSRPETLLRFANAGGDPEENAMGNTFGFIALLPGGKFLSVSLSGGKQRLTAGPLGSEPRPFLETQEQSMYPLGVSAHGEIAFLLGVPPDQHIALATAREGRILKRFAMQAAGVRNLALSPDGVTLYYSASGAVWSVPVSESSAPRRLIDGDDVAVDPSGRFLYVKQMSKEPPVLLRVPLSGGANEAIPLPGSLHFTTDPLGTSAVDGQGRVVFEISSPDTFFYRTAVYDPATRSVRAVPVRFDGDIWSPIWTPDGRIAAVGARFESSIWRYHPVKRR
jgi:eukaryotic-like serine/threonine-protein kinase